MNKNPFSELFGIFNKLGMSQKIMLGGVLIVTVVMLGVLVIFLNEPTYAPLFSGMPEEEASKVVEELNNMKVPYKLEDAGRTVKVPQEKVYETRLSLAGKGIPGSGVVGYEIFDKSTMGMSDFMQKLNYKRALEGELAKTIMQEDGVAGARVHIVIPEKTLFKEEERQPTASVVLKLRGNYNLTKTNINAILNLVSSSVEGLTPSNVTLIDTKGRLLSRENDDNPIAVSSSKQYEIKQSVESYLAKKAQEILDNVVGYGNSMVQVNADLNFNQVEKTMETYDPESQVAISEQTVKTENGGKSVGDSTLQSSQNSTTNYEINKTIQKVVEGTGNVNRLTVAVVLNDIPKEVKAKNGKTETVYDPRPEDQLKKLEEIIKNAVGINSNRQDKFSIISIPFETKTIEDVVPEETPMFQDMDKMTNLVLIVIAIIASGLILRMLMNRLKNEKIVIGTYNPGDLAFESSYNGGGGSEVSMPQQQIPHKKKNLLPVGDLEDEISDEASRKKTQHEKIGNYVTKNPTDAAKLINAWLHEDEF